MALLTMNEDESGVELFYISFSGLVRYVHKFTG